MEDLEQLKKRGEEILKQAEISKKKGAIEKLFLDSTKAPMTAVRELIKEYNEIKDEEKKSIFVLAVKEAIKEKLESVKDYKQIKADSDKKEIKQIFDDIKIRLALLSEIQKNNYHNIKDSFEETYDSVTETLEKAKDKKTKLILLNKIKNIYGKLLASLQASNSSFLRKKETELLKLKGVDNKASREKIIAEYINNISEKKYKEEQIQDLLHIRGRYITILKNRNDYLTDENEISNNQSEIEIECELQQAIQNYYSKNFRKATEKEQELPKTNGANSEQPQNEQEKPKKASEENKPQKENKSQTNPENDEEANYIKAQEEYKKAKEAYQNIKKEITNLEEQIKNASQEEIESLNQRKELQEKELKEKKADLFLARGRLISISKERYKKGHTNIKRNIYELLKEHIEDIEYYIKLNKNEKNMPAHIGITSEFVWKIEKANASLSLLKYAEVEDKVNNLGGTIKNVASPIGTLLKVPIIVPLKLGSKALSTVGKIIVQPIDVIYKPIGKLIHFDSKYNTQKIQDAGKRLGEILATPTNTLESAVRRI